jgi:hypothetical protein
LTRQHRKQASNDPANFNPSNGRQSGSHSLGDYSAEGILGNGGSGILRPGNAGGEVGRAMVSQISPRLITATSILATRQRFAENFRACIDEARQGTVEVNNLSRYCAWCESCAIDALNGKYDHTITFLQRAWFIQTGESVPLL